MVKEQKLNSPSERRGMRRRRLMYGAVMATILMVATLAAVIAFTLAGTSVFHLSVNSMANNRQQARNLAESAIALGIERLMADSTYGTVSHSGYNEVLKIQTSGGETSAAGLLTFNSTLADSAVNPLTGQMVKIQYSTNNLENQGPVDGSTRRVPKCGAHLVGTGICNGVVKSVEVIVHFPPFPYAIASSGNFHSNGGLLLAGLQRMEEGVIVNGVIDEKKLIPGHLAANSNNETEAVVLGTDTKITGNVQSPGGIKLDSNGGTVILGEIRRNSSAIKLPKLDVTSYDPAVNHAEDCMDLPDSIENQKIEGFCRKKGDLTVKSDLVLNGATLYVDGNLKIKGAIRGKGGIFVTGTTAMEKGGTLSTDNAAAIVSKGDVTLYGSGRERASFQGLLYTEGELKAENITLLGSFVTNSKNAGSTSTVGTGATQPASNAGNQTMNNVSMIHVPDYEKIDIASPPGERPPGRLMKPVAVANSNPYITGGATIPQPANTNLGTEQPAGAMYIISVSATINPEDYYDPGDKKFHPERLDPSKLQFSCSGYHVQQTWVVIGSAYGLPPFTAYAFGNTTDDQAATQDEAGVKAFCNKYGLDFESYKNSAIQAARDKLASYNQKFEDYVKQEEAKIAAGQTNTYTLDMSRFLQASDKMRILLWRDI